ncbi:ras-related protein Rab-18A-like [Galleria mellonella]|uniref:Ras-related protein Rab-18A-like n=1 Tax=Galleria mellonella TaxID=7137 RepID=A0ABM3MSX1_GALME|nr:ras-related protein Rab-18A-like [Galleria mellonella]
MDGVRFKILLIGDSAVGKTNIILAFTKGRYNPLQPVTVGVDYKIKDIEVNGVKVKLSIWDTAGQEKFSSLIPSFYRNAHGAIFVYDTTEPQTLANLEKWLQELKDNTTRENVVCLVAGNKIDRPRAVRSAQGQAFAQKHKMLYFECSAKNNDGINLIFEELVQKIIETSASLETSKSSNSCKAIVVQQKKYRQYQEDNDSCPC